MSFLRAINVLFGLLCGMVLVAAVLYYFFGMIGVCIAPFLHYAICRYVTPLVEKLQARLLNG